MFCRGEISLERKNNFPKLLQKYCKEGMPPTQVFSRVGSEPPGNRYPLNKKGPCMGKKIPILVMEGIKKHSWKGI